MSFQLCVHIHHNPFVVCFRNGTKNCNFVSILKRNFQHFFVVKYRPIDCIPFLINSYFFPLKYQQTSLDIDSICNSLLSTCEIYLIFYNIFLVFISIAHRDVRMHTLHSAVYIHCCMWWMKIYFGNDSIFTVQKPGI